ncbi:MAG: galactokinase, partial [Mycobacteriales bacterium]
MDPVATFSRAFAREPVVVGRAPGRVNLLGEHTDYNAGLCLPLALPRSTWAAVAPREDSLLRCVSAEAGDPFTGPVDEATGWARYVAGVLWALRAEGYDVPGLDVAVTSDLPVGAGLSSSAALECAVGTAVADLLGERAPDREGLRDACIRAETEFVGAPTGGLDQTTVLFAEAGAALLLDFRDAGRTVVPLHLAEAGLSLLVIDTRVSHALTDSGYGDRRAECAAAASALGVPTLREASLDDVGRLGDLVLRARARHVVTENTRVGAAVPAVAGGHWAAVGDLMTASHLSLRDDFEVSCRELDLAVDTALDAGALGARMTGGGFGGSAVALVRD